MKHMPLCLILAGLSLTGAAKEWPVESVAQLKSALTSSASGDSIILKPGLYDLSGETPVRQKADYPLAYLVIQNKQLVVRGENEGSWRTKDRASEAIIKGGDKAAIFYPHGGTGRKSSFYNLTFEDACSTNDTAKFNLGGGAISYVSTDGAGAVVSNCVFRNCRTDKNGGAICYLDAVDCYFTNCTSSASGGAVYGGFRFQTGGIYHTNEYRNCVFECNSATNYGGAVYCEHASKIEGCVFRGNSAKNGAGVFGSAEGFGGEAVDCVFSDNQATSFTRESKNHNRGTHIAKFRRAEGCVFSGAGDVYVQQFNRCQFTNCQQRFIDNYSGLITFDAKSGCGTVRNTLFDHCSVPRLITTAGTSSAIENCTFADNTLSGYDDNKKMYFFYAFRGYDKIVDDKVAPSTNVIVNGIFANNKIGDYSADVNFYCATASTVVSPCANIVSNCVYGVLDKSHVAWNAPAIAENFVQKQVVFVAGAPAYPGVAPYTPLRKSGVANCGLLLDWMPGSLDLAGNPRVNGTTCDLGCYERWLPEMGLMLIFR